MMKKAMVFKKTAYLVLALLLILSTLVVLPVGAAAEDEAVGWADSDPANKIYYIASAADMKLFQADTAAQSADATVYLTADIDMSEVADWAPLNSFSGIFDGQGHIVSNLSSTASANNGAAFIKLFDGTIQNVIFDKISYTVTTEVSRVGLVAGHVYDNNGDGATAWFKNVTVKNGTLSTSKSTSAGIGGFAGQISTPTAFENCVITDSVITGQSKNGGFAGYAKASGSVSFTNCYSNCNITASSYYTGSFIGYAEVSTYTFANCVGAGVLQDNAYVGGFIGFVDYKVPVVEMTDCAFIGTIADQGEGNGGFIGRLQASVTLTRCINSGKMFAQSGGKAGGFFYLYGSNNKDSEIENIILTDCYSIGNQSTGLYAIAEHTNLGFSKFQIVIGYTGKDACTTTVQTTNASDVDTSGIPALSAKLSAPVRLLADTTAAGTTVNLTKETFADYDVFTNWVLTGDTVAYNDTTDLPVMLPAAAAGLLGKCPIPTTDIYYQKQANDDGTVNIRFVAVIDDLRYANVGFRIQATRSDGSGESQTSGVITKTTDTVYTSVTALGETVTAESLGGKYIYVIEIQNVNSSDYAHTFSVSAFVTMQDTTVLEAATQTVTVDKAS